MWWWSQCMVIFRYRSKLENVWEKSQFCRQNVPGSRTSNSDGAVIDGCTTCGWHQNFSQRCWTQPTTCPCSTADLLARSNTAWYCIIETTCTGYTQAHCTIPLGSWSHAFMNVKHMGTYKLDTDIVFLTYFNDCDHLWLAVNMFSALKSC